MRFASRGIGLLCALMTLALTPIFALTKVIVGLSLDPVHERRSIIVRKVRSLHGAGVMFRRNRESFGGGMSLAGSIAMVGFFVCVGLTAIAAGLLIATIQSHELHAGVALANGAFAVRLKEKEGQIVERQNKVGAVFKAAGGDLDFSKKEVLTLLGASTTSEAVEKLRGINDELDTLAKDREEIVTLKNLQERNQKFSSDPVNNPTHPTGEENDLDRRRKQKKSLGELVVGSRAWGDYMKSRQPAVSEEKDFGVAELKTAMTTSAGWAPESTRTGVLIEKATRPLQLLDIIPTGNTGMAAVVYMEETTRTHSGAERSEAAVYAEDAFALTQQSSTVRSIGTSLPVTDEQLEDVQQAQSYIDQRLLFSCRQRLDSQILLGDGIAPNLQGIKTVSGIQTQAKSTDSAPDAFFKAMTKVRVTGRAFPSAHVVHPTDWQNIRLLRTADGIYIWGNPSEAGPDRMWGLQVVQCDADSAGTGYVGDFINFIMLYERKGIEVAVGYVNDDFAKGKRTVRAGLRVALVTYRGAAFCKVTGL